jgi:hypothetical protein
MFIGAVIAAIVAVVLFFIARGQAAKAFDIASTKTSTVAELKDLAIKIGAEIGSGSYAEFAELKGKAASDAPLRADFSGTECVWYECVVTREYEEEYWEKDAEGREQRRTRRGSDEMSSILRDPPFFIDDSSGRIRVDPTGAEIESEKSFSSFEQGMGSESIRVGSFTLNLGMSLGSARRTLGYRFEERCVPVGRELYALGEVSDSGGSLALRKPSEKGKRYLISTRSEEAILAGAKTGTFVLRIIAGVAAAGAVGLAIGGLLGS